jgi:hypothetical protein
MNCDPYIIVTYLKWFYLVFYTAVWYDLIPVAEWCPLADQESTHWCIKFCEWWINHFTATVSAVMFFSAHTVAIRREAWFVMTIKLLSENPCSYSLDETGMRSILHCRDFKANGGLLFLVNSWNSLMWLLFTHLKSATQLFSFLAPFVRSEWTSSGHLTQYMTLIYE